jgi:hypothetical protein
MRLVKVSKYIKNRLVRADVPSALDSEITVSTSDSKKCQRKRTTDRGAADAKAAATIESTQSQAPFDYQIVTEPCDWCLADNPWQQLQENDYDGDDDGILAST